MPFYEYECASCKFYTEIMQKLSDAPLKKCPSCGKGTMKKLISAPVFRLKGGGWYETDFKSDKEAKRNLAGDASGAESKDAAPAETKAADGKSEAKPAAEPAAAAKPAAKPAAEAARRSTAKGRSKTAARKSAPKAKARPGKRRGR
jgi:putative FmdB family regulatory protein